MPKRIHIALPDDHPAAKDLRSRLATGGDLDEVASVAQGIEDADAVVASTSTVGRLPDVLPASVGLLQLVDCGAAARYAAAPRLTIANASVVLSVVAAARACDQVARAIASRMTHESANERVQLGVIGCGTLAAALIPPLRQRHGTTIGAVWVADIRTPRQQLLDRLGVRRSTLDLLLSRSEVVVAAVHPGPTADPLLGSRELRLLPVGACVIDLASASVVDSTGANAELSGNALTIVPADASAHERDATHCVADAVDLVAENIRALASGDAIRSVVEHLDYPSAGDPAFWSSRMSPSRA